MRPPTRRRLPALLAAAVLAAALSAVTAPSPPPAAADNQSPSPPTVLCTSYVWNPGFGRHDCHNLVFHFSITSTYHHNVNTICTPGFYLCTGTWSSRPCDSPSQTASCPGPSGTGWYHYSSRASGPYSHPVASTATFGCSPSRHRFGSDCHAHPLTPLSNWVPYCGIWVPHNGQINPPTRPTRGGNPNPPTPSHNSVDLGPCSPVNPIVNPPIVNPPVDPPVDPIVDPNICTTGVDGAITDNLRQAWIGELWWESLVSVGAQGEPGEPWPPHPYVPGAVSWLVVSRSPVWPVVDPDVVDMPWAATHGDDGCPWLAIGVQTRMEQMLPWRAAERRMVEAADVARPDAGLGAYLQRWDNLRRDQQAEVIANQPDHDFTTPRCDLAVAAVSADSKTQCSWELPVPGVWHWQALACFEADIGHRQFQDCAPLASGVAWFLSINDYTQGITLNADPDGVGAGLDT